MLRQNENGFTLIELVMVIILSGIMVAVSMRMLAVGFSAYLKGSNAVSAEQQAHLALERMARDIRAVRSPADISTATASQLTFTDFTGNSIAYSLSSTNLTRGSQILAGGISSLTFSYYDLNGNTTATLTAIRYIGISLNVTQGGSNFTISTAVYPENLP